MSGEAKRTAKETTKTSARKILIVEDHPVFREGLRQLVNREPDLTVCGESDNAAQALKEIPVLQPDLVLVDLTLPGMSGLQLIKEIRALGNKIKLLVVSMHDQALYADRVLRAGGDGYIMKQEDPEDIIHAIRDVLAGHIYVSDEVFAASKATAIRDVKNKSNPIAQLTDGEVEILELLGRGQSNEEIAAKLNIGARTVARHTADIKRKLKLKTDNALVRYAVCWIETGAA
jgi:DNA-binding NarL/FixJ family response regulator